MGKRKWGQEPEEGTYFEEWLWHRRNQNDEVGKVARYVHEQYEAGNWRDSLTLYMRHDRDYDLLAHFVRVLENEGLPEESIEAFRRVYEKYERSGPGGNPYDQKVEAAMERIDASFDLPEILGGYAEEFERYANEHDLALWLKQDAWNVLVTQLRAGEEPDFEDVTEAAMSAAEPFK